jgi:PAS domain S-box-containing protein
MSGLAPMSRADSSSKGLSGPLLLSAGLLSGTLGAMALIGWMAHWPRLTQFSPEWAPVHWSSALCLVMLGLAVPLLAGGRRRMVAAVGMLVFGAGLVTLLEYVTGSSSSIDQLFSAQYIAAPAAYPGRMSVLSASCYTSLGVGLVFAAFDRIRPWRLGVTGLAACVVWVVCLLALLGYATGIDAAYSWGALTRMALPTAIANFGVSGALLAWAWETSHRVQFNLARWLPITASVTLMAMVACVSGVSLVKLKNSIYWRKHTYEVLASAQAMLADLADNQRGMRGYVLTRHSESLALYRQGLVNLPRQLTQLRELTRDNPSQQARVALLSTDLERVVEYSRRLLTARDARGLDGAVELETTGEGRITVDRMRADLDAFSTEEHRLLAARDSQAQRDFHNTTDLLVTGSVCAAVLLILAHLMASREVNRRRRMEARLEQGSALQAAILNSANYAIVSTDATGTVTTFNATAERWLGYRAQDVIGKASPALWHDPEEVMLQAAAFSRELGQTVPPGFETFAAQARFGPTRETQWSVICRDGRRFPASLSASELTDSSGSIVGYLSVLADTGERKRHEAQMRLSEERFRHAFDEAPIGMCLVSPEGRLQKVNRALCGLLGYSESELLQTDFQSITHEEDLRADLERVRKVLSGDIPSYQLEKRYRHRDGSVVYTNLSVSLVRDRDNAPLYFVSQIENIAHRREMDRLKREFISTVSHELRTPLTSIRGSLGLVEAGVLGVLPEKAQDMVKIARQNCERLVRIINDILDVEKIESGRLQLRIAPIALADFLRQSIEENAGYGEKYQVRFVLEHVPDNIHVLADPDRLMQVMSNLLSNAAKFSPVDSQVQIRAVREGAWINISVEDHGTGIPQAFRNRIFEKFAQADASSSRRFDGTGLGLSITQHLVQAMGGNIGFTTLVGEGTTFSFQLPAAGGLIATSPPPSVTGRHCVLVCGEHVMARERPTRVPRILHVEDDLDLSRVIETALAGRADVVTAPSLEAAHQHLRQGEFSLIVLDLGLPDGSGLALLEELQSPIARRVPVVILSVTEVSAAVRARVAAALVKSRLSEGDVINTILSLVPA